MKAMLMGALIALGTLIGSTGLAHAANGSMLVPDDLLPGNYFATPTGSMGYVEVCADYQCDVGTGLIENYLVSGRTVIVVPPYAVMVNVTQATLTPMG